MEHILLMHGHHIDELEDFLLRIIISSAVKVHSSPGKLWSILDIAAWQCPFLVSKAFRLIYFSRKELLDSLHCVEPAGITACSHLNAFRSYIKNITLWGYTTVVDVSYLRFTLERIVSAFGLKYSRCRNYAISVSVINCCNSLEYGFLV